MSTIDLSDDSALNRFKFFLRLPTITHDGPKGSFMQAINWLQELCHQASLESQVLEYVEGYPVFLISIPGSDPSLPSILLNSHYDVVPVMAEHWNTDPFGATETTNGEIVARGAQDMKCVCTAYIEAIMRLKSKGVKLRRNVYLSFVPDEETGGFNGMAKFVQSDEFKKLNVGFALDEGLANETDKFTVFYGERAVWWLRIISKGPTGHGSRFIPDTATINLIKTINNFLSFRESQQQVLESGISLAEHTHVDGKCAHTIAATPDRPVDLGDVVTVNLTMLKAGVTPDFNTNKFAVNVIPMQAECAFDIRIPPHIDIDGFEKVVRGWLTSPNMDIDFYQHHPTHHVTDISERNKYWSTFQSVMSELNHEFEARIFPAGTDSRYLRQAGIPAIGFSPMNNTKVLLHDHNERIHKNTYLKGIKIYEKLISDLANMEAQTATRVLDP